MAGEGSFGYAKPNCDSFKINNGTELLEHKKQLTAVKILRVEFLK